MCGILAFIGEPKNNEQRKLLYSITNNLFYETEIRGSDASGYASLIEDNEGNDKVSFSKLPLPSSMFIEHDIYYRSMWTKKPKIFIGHCRYSTGGSPKINKNNHPFSAHNGDMWMVHNGVCTGAKEIVPKESKLRTDCDSEYIIRGIEGHGWKEGFNKLYETYSDFSLLFLNKEKRSIRFIHNDQRPLWIADTRDITGTYLLSSTKELMNDAFKSCNVKNVKKREVKSNILYEISLDNMRINVVHNFKKVANKPYITPTRTTYEDTDVDDVSLEQDTSSSTCFGCKHIDKYGDMHPCNLCFGTADNVYYELDEDITTLPKSSSAKPSNIEIKFCSTCEFRDLTQDQNPCKSCVETKHYFYEKNRDGEKEYSTKTFDKERIIAVSQLKD